MTDKPKRNRDMVAEGLGLLQATTGPNPTHGPAALALFFETYGTQLLTLAKLALEDNPYSPGEIEPKRPPLTAAQFEAGLDALEKIAPADMGVVPFEGHVVISSEAYDKILKEILDDPTPVAIYYLDALAAPDHVPGWYGSEDEYPEEGIILGPYLTYAEACASATSLEGYNYVIEDYDFQVGQQVVVSGEVCVVDQVHGLDLHVNVGDREFRVDAREAMPLPPVTPYRSSLVVPGPAGDPTELRQGLVAARLELQDAKAHYDLRTWRRHMAVMNRLIAAEVEEISPAAKVELAHWRALGKDLAYGAMLAVLGKRPQFDEIAAYLVDRADQYVTDSPCWVALTDVAHNIMQGDVETWMTDGNLDEDLRRRVAAWRRPDSVPPTPPEFRPVVPTAGTDDKEYR